MSILASTSKRAIPSGKKGAVESPDKLLAAKLRSNVAKSEFIKRTTIGMYTLEKPNSLKTDVLGVRFGVPFFALNDALALKAQKELLPSANLYRVGSFCLYDGKVVSQRPSLVLDNKVV